MKAFKTRLRDTLARTLQAMDELYAPALKPVEVTPSQLRVLSAVRDRETQEQCSQTDLVHATGIDRSTMADCIGRLLKSGLIKRHRHRRDARAYVVRLTEKGGQALEAAEAAAAKVESKLAQSLVRETSSNLSELMSVIQSMGGRTETRVAAE